jgi:hypothetical protein
MTATAAHTIAACTDNTDPGRLDRDEGVTERAPRLGFVIIILAEPKMRVRIQSALPTPFNLVNNVDGQSLNHGDPPCGGSTIGLSAIDRLSRVPMIPAAWASLIRIASTFSMATGSIQAKYPLWRLANCSNVRPHLEITCIHPHVPHIDSWPNDWAALPSH